MGQHFAANDTTLMLCFQHTALVPILESAPMDKEFVGCRTKWLIVIICAFVAVVCTISPAIFRRRCRPSLMDGRRRSNDVAQVTSGVRAVLSHPTVYKVFQRIMGPQGGSEWFVRDFVRPFPGMRILDLGCGPAEILGSLPVDVAYTGYDMSAEYISAAKAKFGARGTFHCRLLEQTEVATLEPFDVVMGIGVLHHLDDSTAQQFMTLAKEVLKPGGRVLTLDACYAPGQNPIARFLVSKDRGQHVRDEAGYRALAEGIFLSIAGAVKHWAWIPYTHWSMECSG